MKYISIFLCFTLFFSACKNDSSKPETISEDRTSEEATGNKRLNNKILSTPEAIAYKYGLEHWEGVKTLTFTFNVDRGSNHFERSFTWNPKTNDVEYRSESDTILYNRDAQLDSLALSADQKFINDSYWLLAPYKLVWDTGTTFSDQKNVLAPISKQELNKLTITYSDQGGYTPGDAYDLYYGNDFTIREWVFRQGNSEQPTMMTTWEDIEKVGRLKLATMHKDKTGNFKLYFTNISVEQENAQPAQ
jgi:hypothetical protein